MKLRVDIDKLNTEQQALLDFLELKMRKNIHTKDDFNAHILEHKYYCEQLLEGGNNEERLQNDALDYLNRLISLEGFIKTKTTTDE